MGEIFINRRSCKIYKNTPKSLKSMQSFTFLKRIQWPKLESLTDRFWPSRLMFDTLDVGGEIQTPFTYTVINNSRNLICMFCLSRPGMSADFRTVSSPFSAGSCCINVDTSSRTSSPGETESVEPLQLGQVSSTGLCLYWKSYMAVKRRFW